MNLYYPDFDGVYLLEIKCCCIRLYVWENAMQKVLKLAVIVV